MKLWSNIKDKIYKNAQGETWFLETIDLDQSYDYVFIYQLVNRKFFFFYELENEWIRTYFAREPNL